MPVPGRDNEQREGGRPGDGQRQRGTGQGGPQVHRDDDGARRHADERDEGQQQVELAGAERRVARGVVGEEREQPGADRPGDQQAQAAPGSGLRGRGLVQRAGQGQGHGTAQQEVQVHDPGPRAAAVVALGVAQQAVPGAQEREQDVDGHVEYDPGQREPGQPFGAQAALDRYVT